MAILLLSVFIGSGATVGYIWPLPAERLPASRLIAMPLAWVAALVSGVGLAAELIEGQALITMLLMLYLPIWSVWALIPWFVYRKRKMRLVEELSG